MIPGKLQGQRGAGGIGCLLLILVVGGGIYAGFQLGVPRVRHSSFSDRLSESIPLFQSETEANVRKRVITMAAEFDIALTPEQVKVTVSKNKVTIEVNYEKFIDLEVWQTTLPFSLQRSFSY